MEAVRFVRHFDEWANRLEILVFVWKISDVHTSPCIFSRGLFSVAVDGWFAIQTNVQKVQNMTGPFLAQLHPSNFFLKIFS